MPTKKPFSYPAGSFSYKNAARYLDVSLSTLKRAMKHPKGPRQTELIGVKMPVIARRELDRYLRDSWNSTLKRKSYLRCK